ncbi:unnamed protein product [Psylliodes chrysocephalus]|uniref:Uncharacterized protein n=1 Tax=Psylliodes chrysocephalus TaxID=3402493 RepID=A0A9P0D8J2_9CUCU|nr:unnamed protein product [Psylliodes chrysocephala]
MALVAQFVVSPFMEIYIQQFATCVMQTFGENIAATEMEVIEFQNDLSLKSLVSSTKCIRPILKIDNAKKTGTGGMGMLTKVDNVVLEIIGKEFPVIYGLGVAESFEKHQEQSCETIPEDDSEGIINKSRPISEHVTPFTSKETYGKRKRVTANNACTYNASALKQEKLTLQVEYLKLKNYRTKLEIRKIRAITPTAYI